MTTYFMASILTKPLQKLLQVSKQIADGDYSVRVPVCTEDEIGELSVNFNYMTEQLVEKLLKLDELLKNQEDNESSGVKKPTVSDEKTRFITDDQ